MLTVIVLWVAAMVAGLSWTSGYAALLTTATVIAFAWTQASTLGHWTGLAQLAGFGLTPWLLAAQRGRDESVLKQLHAEEAVEVAHVSEAVRTLLSLQSATQQMETQITQITDLYHVTKETSRALHIAELFAASLAIAPRLLNARGLRLIDLSGQAPQVLRAARAPDGGLAAIEGVGPSEADQAMIARVLSSKRPASGTAQELGCALPEGMVRISWAPLWRPFDSAHLVPSTALGAKQGAPPLAPTVVRGGPASGVEPVAFRSELDPEPRRRLEGWREQQPIGVLAADELPDEQLEMLSIVANQLSLQLSRIYLYQQVEALAVTDALTGVSVRGYFMERAKEELARSSRHSLSCTLLMVDLDHFKQKNDTFGHLVGDVVLRDVAQLLQRNLREIDMIARFGGEEFLLLLIETSLEQAMPVAERLRQLVEVHPIRAYDELLTQTISMGAAGFPAQAQTFPALIERADQALYAAKRAGRNRVVPWSESLEARG